MNAFAGAMSAEHGEALADREPNAVRDLRAGMPMARPFRESVLLWRVLAKPVAVTSTALLGFLQFAGVERPPGSHRYRSACPSSEECPRCVGSVLAGLEAAVSVPSSEE